MSVNNRYRIMANHRPLVKLNQREIDHYRLDLQPGFHPIEQVEDETVSGTAHIARAMLQGRWFEIVNHHNGGNPSHVIAEFCEPCDGNTDTGCEFCDWSGYHRDQPPIDGRTRKQFLLDLLRPKSDEVAS